MYHYKCGELASMFIAIFLLTSLTILIVIYIYIYIIAEFIYIL